MRKLLNLFVLLAVALRGLVPVGFMLAPAGAEAGGVSVVICSARGVTVITLDETGAPLEQQHHKSDDGVCPYSAPLPVAVASEYVEPSAPADRAPLFDGLRTSSHEAPSRPELPLPGRGPPLLA